MEAPFELLVQDRTWPAPSSSPLTVDWLPNYLSYSWLAYGSLSTLAISMAPFPLQSDARNLGLRQVIDMPVAGAEISCVRWAPQGPSLGLIAAACGHRIYIYGPKELLSPEDCDRKLNSSGLLQGWTVKYCLDHAFHVWSTAWTESGDGLLSVGTDVVMWSQNESVWYQVWNSHATSPQFIAAATWSAKGLSATADGSYRSWGGSSYFQSGKCNNLRGRATVWWWEDSLGLLETELLHPQEVLMIQWRPSKGPFTAQEPHRPVLLTACKDGAVRLWLEIDSGRARLDKALGKDVPKKQLKPAYFVSAIIEAESCLHGALGEDLHVTWAFELRSVGSVNFKTNSTSLEVNTVSKHQSAGFCEWVVGIGPKGSICLWSLFCLDDISPPRCPRVFLWKQAANVISGPPATHATYGTGPILLKVVAHRVGDIFSDPPSSLDLFYVHSSHFQWSRLWPPLSALGGGGSSVTCGATSSELINAKSPSGTARKDAWGIAVESLHATGHSGDIVNIAIHPVVSTGLVATLDHRGQVLVWCISTFAYTAGISTGLCAPIWKPCGHFIGSSDLKFLTWLPAVFLQDQTVLLHAYGGLIKCFAVSKARSKALDGLSLVFNFLFAFDIHAESTRQGLQGLWAYPRNNGNVWSLQNKTFTIVGLGRDGHEVLFFNLDVSVGEVNGGSFCNQFGTVEHGCTNDRSEIKSSEGLVSEENINIVVSAVGTLKLEDFEQVTCLDVIPSLFTLLMEKEADSSVFDPVPLRCPYQFATGSVNGMLKLWDEDELQVEKSNQWHCVGALKVCSGSITKLAIGNYGLKVATVVPVLDGTCDVLLWDIEAYADSATFILSSRISLACPPASIQWLDTGKGRPLLGLLTNTDLRVYAEATGLIREPSTPLDIENIVQTEWALVASALLPSSSSCFSWGPKASLLVPIQDHLLVYGPIVLKASTSRGHERELMDARQETLQNQAPTFWTLFEAVNSTESSLPSYHPIKLVHHLHTGNHQRARMHLSYLQGMMTKLYLQSKDMDKNGSLQVHPMHLMEILQPETMKKNVTNLTEFSLEHKLSMNWTASFAEDSQKNLSGMGGLHYFEDVDRTTANHSTDNLLIFDKQKLEGLVEEVGDKSGLSKDLKFQLLAVADVLEKLNSDFKAKEYASLDLPGQRFWLSLEVLRCISFRRTGKDLPMEGLVVDAKAMAWALQSDSKDTLVDVCLGDQLSWPAMRSLGIGFWLTDTTQLRMRVEKLARAQYLVARDPKQCALLYLALERKNVLMGLFKLSKDEKDRVLFEFLARNFEDKKHQAAALKNAYVLMGKHRHDLAAAFFLLGGDLSSAAGVCAKNLEDLQLAFVVCRLLEGVNGPTERNLIKEFGLPYAKSKGDCWLASLFQLLLGESMEAIQELTGKLNFQEDKDMTICFSSTQKRGFAFVDPEVGIYCLKLASKPSFQSESSVNVTAATRKWLICKTSMALEKLGFTLEALENLNTIVSLKEAGLNGKYASLKDCGVHDDMSCGWLSTSISKRAFRVIRMRLAMQHVAELLEAHPFWRLSDYVESFLMLMTQRSESVTSLLDSKRLIQDQLLVKANERLTKCLEVLETRLQIHTKNILAELATFAYYQNRLYFQCLFSKGPYDQLVSKSNEESIPTLPLSSQFLQKAIKELPKFLVYSGLAFRCASSTSMKNSEMLKNASPLYASDALLPLEEAQILTLALDLRIMLLDMLALNVEQADDHTNRFSEAISLLVFLLCCIAAWKGSHADAILLIIKSVRTCISSSSTLIFDVGKFLKTFLRENDAILHVEKHPIRSLHVSSVEEPNHWTDFEIWLTFGASFWDALNSFIRKCSDIKLFGSPTSSILSLKGVGDRETVDTEGNVLSVFSCISTFLKHELATYVKLSIEKAWPSPVSVLLWHDNISAVDSVTSLSSGTILGSHTNSQTSPHRNNSEGSSLSASAENPLDEVWRLLGGQNRIASALRFDGILGDCVLGAKIKERATHTNKNTFENAAPEKKSEGSSLNGNRASVRRFTTKGKGFVTSFKDAEEVLHSSGDLFEAMCVNSCCPEQVAIASNRKGLIFIDLTTGNSFSETESNLWSQAEWPRDGWARSESTPVPTIVSPGFGLASKDGPGLGLGGATVGFRTPQKVVKESSLGGPGFGVPGYGGLGGLGWGWEGWEEFDGVVDPPASTDNVSSRALDAHPLRPLFLVGSRNTHVYLWEFGKTSATATYGVLPAANIPPPYVVASISAVKFDHSGHRFATAAIDGTVCTWQLEVGGRSNVRPSESCLCFDRHASDVAFVGASGAIAAATGCSQENFNLVFWDTLAPPTSSRASVLCHEGGARCLEMLDHDMKGSGSVSPIIITGGKAGDIAVHDFRCIATGKAKRQRHPKNEFAAYDAKSHQVGELNSNGMIWYIDKAHAGSVQCISAIPGTSLFISGGKDGDIKLWDVNKCELLNHWHKVHDKHMFLQHNVRGFGAVQAAVTDIKPVSSGFLTCGGDGILRRFRQEILLEQAR